MAVITLGLVSIGKIVRDQHLPVLQNHPDFEVAAAASRNATVEGTHNFTTIEEMLDAMPDLEAVALCMPPHVRYAAARTALEHGCHVLLEKPPAATLSEIDDLAALAARAGRTLYATWHSRHAPAVEDAKALLAGAQVRSVDVQWKEDVRKWHPGQAWIWEAGGFGVFDPGINALSIMTYILPRPFFLKKAVLAFPANRDAPIAADLSFADTHGIPVAAQFDWRQTGGESWDITVETDKGQVVLSHGGAKLAHDGAVVSEAPEAEYRTIYDRFASLIGDGRSDVDVRPLTHVADAFMLGRRETVEPFED